MELDIMIHEHGVVAVAPLLNSILVIIFVYLDASKKWSTQVFVCDDFTVKVNS